MLIRKSQLRMAHNNLFEWNLGNGRWYPINCRNIVFSVPATVQRVFFNAVFQGKTVKATATYSKPKLHVLSVDPAGMSPVPESLLNPSFFELKVMRLTEEKYRCVKCGKRRRLVITRNRATMCKTCYKLQLAKRKILRELNKIADEMLPKQTL